MISSMTLPQPFQYQGSKRALAALILQYLTGPGGAGRKYPRFNWHITDIATGQSSPLALFHFPASKAPAAVAPKRRYGAPRRRKGWRTP
jgi:hypothetical protein